MEYPPELTQTSALPPCVRGSAQFCHTWVRAPVSAGPSGAGRDTSDGTVWALHFWNPKVPLLGGQAGQLRKARLGDVCVYDLPAARHGAGHQTRTPLSLKWGEHSTSLGGFHEGVCNRASRSQTAATPVPHRCCFLRSSSSFPFLRVDWGDSGLENYTGCRCTNPQHVTCALYDVFAPSFPSSRLPSSTTPPPHRQSPHCFPRP